MCVYIPDKHPYITIEYKRFYYCVKNYINGDLIVFGPKSIKSKLENDVVFCEMDDITNKTFYTYKNKKSYGTGIYVIKKEGAKKILNYYNNIKLNELTYNDFHNNINKLWI